MSENSSGTSRRSLKIPLEVETRLKEIALSLGKLHGTNGGILALLSAIANQELEISNPLSEEESRSLVRGVSALIEKGDMKDARTIAGFLIDRIKGEPLKKEMLRLYSLEGWVKQAEEYIDSMQPFLLQTEKKSYTCLFADFWIGDVGEGRTYLRAWVEEEDLQEVEELRHNRTFRLDRNYKISPIEGKVWKQDGIDTIDATLHLKPNFKYTPKPEDVSVELITDTDTPYIEVVKKVFSTFWLLQTVLRYGDRCVIRSPQTVVERIVSELKNVLAGYEV